MDDIVSVEWLQQNIQNKDLILLDASIRAIGGSDLPDLDNSTIAGARYFDLKGNFTDKSSQFPNTLPSSNQFEHECQKIGINQSSVIVVFDNLGVYSSPRVWWLFKTMGHDQVAVLDGGLPEWIKKGNQVAAGQNETYSSGDFIAQFKDQNVKYYEDVINNISSKSFTIIDARSEGRFKGIQEEPRKHLKSGSIPHSINIPYSEVLEDGKFKSEKELHNLFQEKGLGTKDLVFSCGSGLTACIVMLACESGYKQNKYLYDGSWSEWAELQNLKTNLE